MTTPDYQKALGRKIAAERRRRGLSQPELARMIDRSVAWVSQVERGVRKVDRMSVLEALAAALDVPLAELAAEAPVVAAVTEESPGAGGLRLVLSGAYALRAMMDGQPRPCTQHASHQVPQGVGPGTCRAVYRPGLLAARPGSRPGNCRAGGAAGPAGRGVRADGRDLPGVLGSAGQARRARGGLDRGRPRDGCRRTGRQPAAGGRWGVPAGVRLHLRPPLRPGRGNRSHGGRGTRGLG